MSVDFLGHAVALHSEDSYMRRPALESVLKIKLYYESMMRYEGLTSPYIYPLYGLGELPQAFARLSAVYGGTYMLARADAEVVFDPDTGRAVGVSSEGQTAHAKFVVGDPSYFPDKVCPVTEGGQGREPEAGRNIAGGGAGKGTRCLLHGSSTRQSAGWRRWSLGGGCRIFDGDQRSQLMQNAVMCLDRVL